MDFKSVDFTTENQILSTYKCGKLVIKHTVIKGSTKNYF